MARVFLSHASSDKPIVRRIAEALRAAGHEPWLDEDKILVGESIPEAVGRGLQEAEFVVVCLSKAAAERGWVEAERDATVMQQFRERNARILPVRMEEVDPPYLISRLAYVDIFPDNESFQRGIQRLVRSIEEHEARAAGRRLSRSPGAGSAPVSTREALHLAQGAVPPGSALHQLRPIPADFTGREEEIADLRAKIGPRGAIIAGLTVRAVLERQPWV